MKLFACALAALVFTTAPPVQLLAQTPDETKAQVRELAEFHEVIFKIWHEAWPAKDVAMLKSLLPAVDSGARAVEQAALPGILRDRKAAWDESLKALRTVVAEYASAVAGSDTQKILDAAEKLHARYEQLVRVTRPVLKEIDSFHQVLYVLYHYAMPAYDLEKIRSSTSSLQSAMDTLNAASLPERLKGKQKDFEARRKALRAAVQELDAALKAQKGEKEVKKAITKVHTCYQALEKVF